MHENSKRISETEKACPPALFCVGPSTHKNINGAYKGRVTCPSLTKAVWIATDDSSRLLEAYIKNVSSMHDKYMCIIMMKCSLEICKGERQRGN